MATGPDHYQEAERLLRLASAHEVQAGSDSPDLAHLYAEAQVHATLALAAATALNGHSHDEGGMPLEDYNEWVNAAAVWKPTRRRGGEDQ
ncbi:hypothetical protein [Streptomyces sp. NPDC003996]